jgi:hypothetical protein
MRNICEIPDCGKFVVGRGWCRMHYGRWDRHGDPNRTRPPKAKCSIDSCENYVYGHGWCRMHWQRWKRNGGPLKFAVPRIRETQHFMLSALSYDGDECLIWPFGRNEKGYGNVTHKGGRGYAHRFICEEAHGKPPSPTHEAAHSCGKGHLGCITKRHLRWATPQENSDDRAVHGTVPQGEKVYNAKLTDADVTYIRSKSGVISQTQLAYMFGVTQSTVRAAIIRKSWKHVQ